MEWKKIFESGLPTLPETDRTILLCNPMEGMMDIGFLGEINEKKRYILNGGGEVRDFTYWMYAPELPYVPHNCYLNDDKQTPCIYREMDGSLYLLTTDLEVIKIKFCPVCGES